MQLFSSLKERKYVLLVCSITIYKVIIHPWQFYNLNYDVTLRSIYSPVKYTAQNKSYIYTGWMPGTRRVGYAQQNYNSKNVFIEQVASSKPWRVGYYT